MHTRIGIMEIVPAQIGANNNSRQVSECRLLKNLRYIQQAYLARAHRSEV